MKNYIIGRLLRAVVSLFIVVSIAIVMVFLLIPRDRIFENDQSISKLSGKKDLLAAYKLGKLKDLGYLDYKAQKEICEINQASKDCFSAGSSEINELIKIYEKDGYTINKTEDGFYYVVKDYKTSRLILNFYSNLIKIDHTGVIKDPNNLELERKVYFAKDHNGMLSIKCSGCENQYLLYFNGSFPFIHQNFIKLNFGISYPTYIGLNTFSVISNKQGELKNKEITFETGTTAKSAINLHSCTYKMTEAIDDLDKAKFINNYAKCTSNYTDPSMIEVSYIMGILSLVFSYLISIPLGVVMAKERGKLIDKIGIIYVNLMIAVPSLAFIFFVRNIGSLFKLPDKFSQLGFTDVRSYIMPVIILTLLSTSSLIIWVRRYMVDQTNSDYVKFAKAKGLSEKEIFNTHILKNAIIPIVNGIPSSIILSIGGAVITETIFAIPGMGKMLPDSIKAVNNNMVITLTFIFTALSVFSLVLGDVLMALIDPRIKLDNKGGSR